MKHKPLFYLPSIVLLVGCSSSKNETPPNIILIMADDLGYNDLSCYGSSKVETPAIDSLAKNGVVFTDFHSNGTVSSPTRASLMTGKYPQRTGIRAVVTAKSHRHTGLALEEYTIAEYCKEQGYATGLVGKWHLGYDTLFSPVRQGFDFFRGFVSGNVDYHSHIDQEGHFDWWDGTKTIDEKGYSTDLITQSAIEFINANQSSPFFLYVAHEAPHYPYQGRKDPPERALENGQFVKIKSTVDRKKTYREMIEVMDEGIGKVIHVLEENKLLENTIIFFCSDNGASLVGSNYPLKGHKGSVWEGGHRVPAIAYWKGKIQPRKTNQTALTMDIFPTIVDLIAQPTKDSAQWDGTSLVPLLFSNQSLPKRPLYWQFHNRKAVRSNEWKLHVQKDTALYNLSTDVSETTNLLSQNTEIADTLLQLLHQWEQEMSAYPNHTK